MEEAPDPIVIPGWIWVIIAMLIVGVLATLIVKRDRRRESRHHSGRSHGHDSGRSHGHSHRSRRRRRQDSDPFDKY